jgi:hypothetical protein
MATHFSLCHLDIIFYCCPVFSTNLETDYIYFNAISCVSESKCVVVGEGDDAAGGYLVVAYTTLDGGATWEKTLSANDVGLAGAVWASDSEVWLVGTSKQGRQLYGQFRKSTDGGKTFALQQSLPDCYGIDIDFGKDVGFAACVSSSGASCAVAMYV